MVFPLGWGVMGAALATSIACVVGGVMVLAYFVRFADKLRFYPLKWTLTSLLLTLRNTGYIFFDQYCLYRILSEHRESDGFHRIYAVAWHIVSGAVFPAVVPGVRCLRLMARHSGRGADDVYCHFPAIHPAEF